MESSPSNPPEATHPHPLLKVLAVGGPLLFVAGAVVLIASVYSSRPDTTWVEKILWTGQVQAVWDGQLIQAEGLDLEEGTPCLLEAEMTVIDGLGEPEFDSSVELSCAGQSLFSGSTIEGSENLISCKTTEYPSQRPGTYTYELSCNTVDETKLEINLNSPYKKVVLSREGKTFLYVDLRPKSRPVRGPPLRENHLEQDPGFDEPLEMQAFVTQIEGRVDLEPGDRCQAWIHPFWAIHTCFIEIFCEDQVILVGNATGFGRCEVENGMPVRMSDNSYQDGDPKLELDMIEHTARVYDEEDSVPWSVSLSLFSPVLRQVCPPSFEDRPNDDGVDYCLLRPLVLPEAEGIEPECEELHQGYMGFRWTPGVASESYTCPRDSERLDDEDGTAHCRWTLPELPPEEVEADCGDLLTYGSMSYYFPNEPR